jgi:hypothetical protein
MTRPIHLELFTDFFNKIGRAPQERVNAGQEDLGSRGSRGALSLWEIKTHGL